MSCRHCGCDCSDMEEDRDPNGMHLVLQSIDDAQLMALWSLCQSVSGADRKIVRQHIRDRIKELRIKAWKSVEA